MSDEYIRRQEMLEAVDHLHIIPSIDGTGKPTSSEDFRVQFIGTVLKVKSADVVQVVRCKDCKHLEAQTFRGSVEWLCFYNGVSLRINPDDFCCWGARREE